MNFGQYLTIIFFIGLLYNLYIFRYIWKDLTSKQSYITVSKLNCAILTIRSTNKLTICMVLKNCYT